MEMEDGTLKECEKDGDFNGGVGFNGKFAGTWRLTKSFLDVF